jgi:hypothetical protein
MSLNRYVKIASNQGGPFTQNSNNLDFDLDLDKVYNFDNSYIEIFSTVSTTIPTAAQATVLSDSIGKVKSNIANDANICPQNVMLVKNCSIRSSNVGFLEDIRAVDTLRSTLRLYTQNSTSFNSENFKQIGSYVEKNNMKGLMFQELQKEGSVESKNVSACPIRIKLSELFELGDMKEFSTRQQGLGRVRIHLELNPNTLVIAPATANDQNPDLDSPDVIKKFDTVLHTGRKDQITTSLTDGNVYKSLEYSPYFNMCMVKVNALGAGGATNVVDEFRTVRSITLNNNGTLQLTLNSNIGPLQVGESYTNVTAEIVPADTASITYDFAEMVVQEVSNPSMEQKSMTYSTYSTEEVTVESQTSDLQRMFQLEPNAVNLLVMFPNSVLSMAKNLDTFRMRVDNVDVTDRNIEKYSPLYYENLNNTFLSMGLPLRNLVESFRQNDERWEDYTVPSDDDEIVLAGCPLYPSENVKNLQLNIVSDAIPTFSKINLYKQIIKNITM